MIIIFRRDASPGDISGVRGFLGTEGMMSLVEVPLEESDPRPRFRVSGARPPADEPVLSQQLRQMPGVECLEARRVG